MKKKMGLFLLFNMFFVNSYSQQDINLLIRANVGKNEVNGRIEAMVLKQDGSQFDSETLNILERWLTAKTGLSAPQIKKEQWPWREIKTSVQRVGHSLGIISEVVLTKAEIDENNKNLEMGIKETFPLYYQMTPRYVKNCFFKWYNTQNTNEKSEIKMIVFGNHYSKESIINTQKKLIAFYTNDNTCISEQEDVDPMLNDYMSNYYYENVISLQSVRQSELFDGFYDKIIEDLKKNMNTILLNSIRKKIALIADNSFTPELSPFVESLQLLKKSSLKPVSKMDYMFCILTGLKETERNLLFGPSEKSLVKSKVFLEGLVEMIVKRPSIIYGNNIKFDDFAVLINFKKGDGAIVKDIWFK